MRPHIHYDSAHTNAPMADHVSIRTVFAIGTDLKLALEHFNLKEAYISEPYGFRQAVYIREHSGANGSCKHGNGSPAVGILKRNLYGTPSEA